MTLAILREKRTKIAKDMHEMHGLSIKEDRDFSVEESASWKKMEAEIDKLDIQIRQHETLARLGAPEPGQLRAGGTENRGIGDNGGPALEDEYTLAFRSYLKHGMEVLDDEQRTLINAHRQTIERRNLSDREQRALAAGTGNVGGFTVPQGFLDQLEIALKAFGGMMQVADVMRTDTGNTLPMPTFNYTNVLATIVGEGAGFAMDSATPFGVANLGAYTYRSPMLPVSLEFLQDTSFGENYLVDALGGSIARALNAHATTGTGTGQPRGIVTDAVSGKVGLTGQTATVIYNDLVDLLHSVDPAYRIGAAFMMHDQSVKGIRKIVDAQNRPIWLPSYDAGIRDTLPEMLLGYPIQVNQDMAQMSANAKSILFGAFKKYKLRIVRDITVLRLVERYADNLQVGFGLFMRADGRLLDAGTNPVKFYQNSAT